ncbi:MAG: hypothetical protein ABI811_03825 [Acidobacteriota bacterium]
MKTLFLLALLGTQITSAAVVNYFYDPAGRLTKIDYGPGGTITYTYDKAGNILNRVVGAGSNAPAITSVKVAWGGTDISPNSWLEIKGTNIVPADTPAAGVIWNAAPEFAQGRLPTKIGNISVTINGKAAYVYFYCSAVTNSGCSSDQINVLTPLAALPATAQVVVTNGSTSTPPFTVSTKAASPSFLFFTPAGYVVVTHADYSLLGPRTLFPGATTPAHPGEVVLIYTVGFGLPTGALTEGSSGQVGSLASTPTCFVGTTQAALVVTLISPGLYHLNLTIPTDAHAGDNQLSCSYQGASTQSGALISVEPTP